MSSCSAFFQNLRLCFSASLFPSRRRVLCVASLAGLLPAFLGGEGGCGQEEIAPPIKIGVVLPLSGERVSYGRDALNGILVAVEELNRAGGVDGRPIDLLVANNRSGPEGTLEAVSSLDGDGAVAIVGPLASGNALAAAAEAQERRIPLVLPAATHMGVTGAGEYVSRVCFTNEFQARIVAHFAWEFLRARSFAVIVEEESEYSQGLAGFFTDSILRLGGEISLTASYAAGEEVFDETVKDLLSAPIDAVFMPGYYGEVARFLRQAGAAGLGVPILGGDGWDVPLLTNASRVGASGNYFAAHFAADEPQDAVEEFVTVYRKKYGYEPHSLAALGRDAVWFVADALARASGDGRENLKNAINSTRGFQGLTGTLSLDVNRDSVKSGVILKATRAGFEFIQRISPEASGDNISLGVPSGLLTP